MENSVQENNVQKNIDVSTSASIGSSAVFNLCIPKAGRAYSGRVTYVDEVRETFITQYVYDSGRLGYPVEHSMAKANFPFYSPRQSADELQVGDVIRVSYPDGADRANVTVFHTAEAEEEKRKLQETAQERLAAEAAADKKTIKMYSRPKNKEEARLKNMAVLRESSRNGRFENVAVISKDDEKHTITTRSAQGDEFEHDARSWPNFKEIRPGDEISIDYMRQSIAGGSRPYVEDKSARERGRLFGWGDPDFARGGPFKYVKITAIDWNKGTVTTQDAQGRTAIHDASKWGSEKALCQPGDVISIRLPEQGAEPERMLNHTALGRIAEKYELLRHPYKYPASVLRAFPSIPDHDKGDAGRIKGAYSDIKRFFAYELANALNPYKSLTVIDIDDDKNTVKAVNDKGEESVHSLAGYRYRNSLGAGHTINVRYNDLEHPEKGLRIFDKTAYDQQRVRDRFKDVRIIAVNKEKGFFTTQSKTGEKFNHSMRGYKWRGRLQPGHLVSVYYEDNNTASRLKDVFDHTTYQESLIRSLTRRTQEEALEKKPQRAITSRISLIAQTRVFLDKTDKNGKPYCVSTDELTKALNCRESDLKRGDEIQLKVSALPQSGGFREVFSAKSKDVEERIQSQEQERGLER